MNLHLLKSDGSDVAYRVVSGGFDEVDDRLHLALECEIDDESDEESPREVNIRLSNLSIDEAGRTSVQDCHEEWGADDGQPHAYVYTGFHHPNVSAWIEVSRQTEDELVVDVNVVIDDVRYYDERASSDAFTFNGSLPRTPRSDLWGP